MGKNKVTPPPVYKNYVGGSPSLKSISLNDSSENQSNNSNSEPVQHTQIGNLLSEEFTQTDLENAWAEFAESINKEMPRLYQVLKNHQPQLDENFVIHAHVGNELQKKDLDERIYSKLTGWLKSKLKNEKIELTIEVSENENKTQMVYTSTDKFNYLSEKNENLLKLKQNFGLDFE